MKMIFVFSVLSLYVTFYYFSCLSNILCIYWNELQFQKMNKNNMLNCHNDFCGTFFSFSSKKWHIILKIFLKSVQKFILLFVFFTLVKWFKELWSRIYVFFFDTTWYQLHFTLYTILRFYSTSKMSIFICKKTKKVFKRA